MKFGVLVNDLGPGQLATRLLTQANALVASRADLDVLVLYEALRRPCVDPAFATMQVAEGYAFDGPMVATTASTAEKLARFPAVPRKLFYAWDLEWLRPHLARGRSFADWRRVYGNPDLVLVARCDDHARVLANAWNREVAVVEHFDLEHLLALATR